MRVFRPISMIFCFIAFLVTFSWAVGRRQIRGCFLTQRNHMETVLLLFPDHHPLTKSYFPNSALQIALELPKGGYLPSTATEQDEDDDNDDDDDEEEEEEGEEDLADNDDEEMALTQKNDPNENLEDLITVGKRTLSSTFQMLKVVVRELNRMVTRAVHAGLNEEEVDAELPTLLRIGNAFQRMLVSLLDISSFNPTKEVSVEIVDQFISNDDNQQEDDDEEEEEESDDTPPQSSKRPIDYGLYLAKAYKVRGSRDSLDDPCVIHTGSFSDALVAARRQARLLLILIPSKKPSSKNSPADEEALKSFLSRDVSEMSDRKARKQAVGNLGSFFLWSALPGSPEALAVMKRLKISVANNKGLKRPIIAVAYPGQAVDAYGRMRWVPKLLAQHHASPPPSGDMMAAWMNALRKRHATQYAKMQKEVTEVELWKERKQGYESSVHTDKENIKRQEREAAEAKAREEAEKQRQQQIVERRAKLKESLPEEPEKDEPDVKTIAVRMPDGKSAQRRFHFGTPLETIFNWVDVTFEMDREKVELTTLNGRSKYSWSSLDGATLAQVGPSKMTAFRVSQLEVGNDDEKSKNEDEKKS